MLRRYKIVAQHRGRSRYQMFAECADCARLWREYADATASHIRVEDKFKRASLEHNAELLSCLTPQCERAAAERKRTREALRTHEANVHGRLRVAAD